MEALYTEAARCTQEEEKAQGLLESIRTQTEDPKWLEYAIPLAQQAIQDFQRRAVEVDGFIEANLLDLPDPPFISQSLRTLETLEVHIARLCSSEDKGPVFQQGATQGDVVLVELFIQAGVDPSAENNRAIQWASRCGHLSVVNRLVQDARVDPSAQDNSAIQMASFYGHLLVVDRLLQDERVDPSADNNDAIKWASYHGHLAVVNRLLQDARVTSTLNARYMRIFKCGTRPHQRYKML